MTDVNQAFRTEAESAALADIATQTAAGGDPFGDNEEIVPLSAEDRAAAAAAEEAGEGAVDDADADADPVVDAAAEGEGDPAAATQGEVDPTAAEAAAAAAAAAAATQQTTEGEKAPIDKAALEALANEAEQQAAPAPQLPKFEVMSQDEYKAKRGELQDKKDTLHEQWEDGQLTGKEYRTALRQVDDDLESLSTHHHLGVANAQAEFQSQGACIATLISTAKANGELDYQADKGAQKKFNLALKMTSQDPEFDGKPFNELVAQAHKVVMLGRAKPASTPAAAATPAVAETPAVAATPAAPVATPARTAPPAPPTLRNVPAAASSNTGGGVGEQLSRLNGLDFQEAVGKMSKAQRDAFLDSE